MVAAVSMPVSPSIGQVQVPIGPVDGQVPNHADAVRFSDALTHTVAEQSSLPVPQSHGALSQLSTHAEDLSHRLASWHAPSAASEAHAVPADATGGAPDSLTAAMRDAVSGLQGSYAFAIEATLASRGSTEATKIVNTLLKGQ